MTMSSVRLPEVAEVVICGVPKANIYLAHGYVLLAVEQTAKWVPLPPGKEVEIRGYVRKSIIFVLGRPRELEPVALKPVALNGDHR